MILSQKFILYLRNKILIKRKMQRIMVHRLIIFLVFFCVNVQAQRFIKAVIFQHDGTQINCLARLPDASEKTIRFKIDENSKTQKLKSKDIKTVCYYLSGDKTLEIEYLRYISFFEMSYIRQEVFAAEWVEVLVRGDMMLYYILESSLSGQRKYNVYHYYVKRENEEYATEIAYVRYVKDFLIYRMEAGDYFADAPEIERKIDYREEGYTPKDIVNIVQEYNAFKKSIPKP